MSAILHCIVRRIEDDRLAILLKRWRRRKNRCPLIRQIRQLKHDNAMLDVRESIALCCAQGNQCCCSLHDMETRSGSCLRCTLCHLRHVKSKIEDRYRVCTPFKHGHTNFFWRIAQRLVWNLVYDNMSPDTPETIQWRRLMKRSLGFTQNSDFNPWAVSGTPFSSSEESDTTEDDPDYP